MTRATLNRYLFMRELRVVFFFCVGTLAIGFLADFTEFSNRTSGLDNYSTIGAMAIVALRQPFIFMIAIPFVVLFATMTAIMALNQKYELVIARAAGVSAWQFLTPICAAAFFVGVLTVGIVNPIAAAGMARAESLEGEWRARPTDSLLARPRPWLRQPGDENGYTLIGAERALSEPPVLYGASFLEIDPTGALTRRIDAAEATLKNGLWTLEKVRISDADGGQSEFERFELATSLKVDEINQTLTAPEMVPFLSLPGQIASANAFGIPASPFRMQFHSLIALPMLLVAMALIASMVSLRFARFGQSAGLILSGIGAGFVLYLVTAVAKSFGSAGMLPPVLAAWMPVAISLFFGVGFLLEKEDG